MEQEVSDNTEKKNGVSENSLKNLRPWKPGQSGNPGGRPKGTLKDYVSRKFREMSDQEKEDWLKQNKISPEILWKMAEGNPKQDTEVQLTRTMGDVLDELENAGHTPEG